MQFSKRTAWESGENRWAAALRTARESGRILIDLTAANPTACGLTPEADAVLEPLRSAGALRYEPDPLGMRVARGAVARYYAEHGADVAVERICLTSSTSEGYSFLFRLLCDPGDEVLIARPSYPLFDLLAQVEDVELRSYPLLHEPGAAASDAGAWTIDLHALSSAMTHRTRAVVLVHPNNPTGNYVAAAEREAVTSLCAERGIALIVDEVFLDYPVQGGAPGAECSFAAGNSACLRFVLSGLSKVCALPQMKLSWMAVSGPPELVKSAMERLEIVADTFLSVNSPAQGALSTWLEGRREIQERIGVRIAGNLATLDTALEGTAAERLSVEGGWTVVLRVPAAVDREEFPLAALRRGAIVQPGAFYGLPRARCVLSLLTPPAAWERGLRLLPLRLVE